MKDLIAFHCCYKYIVMVHSQPVYRQLSHLLSGNDPRPINESKDAYFEILMTTSLHPAKRKNHCNVLMHLVGYLKRIVDMSARKDILDMVERCLSGEINLATPITLLNHHLKYYGSEYINKQRYLLPYSSPLGIRNTI